MTMSGVEGGPKELESWRVWLMWDFRPGLLDCDRLPVVAVAQPLVRIDVDGVANRMDGAVAEDESRRARMGAAEAAVVRYAGRVL